jgi:putative membrane protein
MMYWNDGWGWGAWIAMGFMMLLFWGVIAAVVLLLVRPPGRHDEATPPPKPPSEDEASRILDARFARGEIDEQEYRARRDLLHAR